MNRFNDFSIRSKIVAIILFVTFFAIVIGLFVIGTRDYNQQRSTLVSNLLINTKLVSDNCVVPLSFGDTQRAQEILSSLKNVSAIDQGILLDEQGNVFAEFPVGTKLNEDIIKLDTVVWTSSKNLIQIIQPIYFNNDIYGTLVINANTNELKTHLYSFIKFSLLIIILLVVLAFILASRMQRYISLPIIKLKNHFDKIAENQDFSASISRQSNDEIGRLYDGFNSLIKQIKTRSKERDTAEANLKDSQNKLNLALLGGEIGVWEWDLATDLTIWDKRMENMFGLEVGEFKQTYAAFKECLHPDDIAITENEIKNALAEKSLYDTIYRVIWKNNEIKYIKAKAVISKSKSGKQVKMTGVCFDITEIKKAEEELKEHKNKLEDLVNERTKELELKYSELEKMNKIFVGRELRMVELKKNIHTLEDIIEMKK